MPRTRIDVAAVLNGREPRVMRRKSMLDVRALRPDPARISTRHSRAVSLADAAMIIGLGDSPRAKRRCAITVQRALDALDEISAVNPAAVDAVEMILARCGGCKRCGSRR